MRRSVINSAYFAIVFSSVANCFGFLIFKEFSIWNFLIIVLFFALVKPQNYLYDNGGRIYYRRVPFFRGIPIEELKSLKDLRLFDQSKNVYRLWQIIGEKSLKQES